MRCIALAQAWQKNAGRAVFAIAAGAELEDRIKSEDVEIVSIHVEPGSPHDATQLVALCAERRPPWLVLDGYHFPASYRQQLQTIDSRLLVLDDGDTTGSSDCDLVLNADPQATQAMYPVVSGGSHYALLRKEFLEFPLHGKEIPATAAKILLTLGGADPHNVTLKALQALHQIDDLALDLTVVLGASYQFQEQLQSAIARSPHAIRLLQNVTNIPQLMAESDLAITAGGVTCYELAFMRVPMFLITMADNHERAVETFGMAKAAFDAGWFSAIATDVLAAHLRHVITAPDLRREFVNNAARMVDGRGAERVVETMLRMTQSKRKVKS
jgi:UDP-2,4-diacetamido-2,4,6-trideoxy-beta-L-altropyranose hydrolase